jgi:hypothetical protein
VAGDGGVGDELVEGVAAREAAAELEEGLAPEDAARADALVDPGADGGVLEALEGADVALVGVADVAQGEEGVHGGRPPWARGG